MPKQKTVPLRNRWKRRPTAPVQACKRPEVVPAHRNEPAPTAPSKRLTLAPKYGAAHGIHLAHPLTASSDFGQPTPPRSQLQKQLSSHSIPTQAGTTRSRLEQYRWRREPQPARLPCISRHIEADNDQDGILLPQWLNAAIEDASFFPRIHQDRDINRESLTAPSGGRDLLLSRPFSEPGLAQCCRTKTAARSGEQKQTAPGFLGSHDGSADSNSDFGTSSVRSLRFNHRTSSTTAFSSPPSSVWPTSANSSLQSTVPVAVSRSLDRNAQVELLRPSKVVTFADSPQYLSDIQDAAMSSASDQFHDRGNEWRRSQDASRLSWKDVHRPRHSLPLYVRPDTPIEPRFDDYTLAAVDPCCVDTHGPIRHQRFSPGAHVHTHDELPHWQYSV